MCFDMKFVVVSSVVVQLMTLFGVTIVIVMIVCGSRKCMKHFHTYEFHIHMSDLSVIALLTV